MSFIKLTDIGMVFGQGGAAYSALKNLSLQIEQGEFTAVVGESGSGKSTLLAVLGALSTPTSGRYVANGTFVYALSSNGRSDFRKRMIGFVFQSFHLLPYLTARQNTMLPLLSMRLSTREKEEAVEKALSSMGIWKKRDCLPGEMSGGEQERAALARAIVHEPPILLADEPTGNLDGKTTTQVMEVFRNLNRQGMTIVMVTHSSRCAAYAGRVLSLADGVLVGDERSNAGKPGPFHSEGVSDPSRPKKLSLVTP